MDFERDSGAEREAPRCLLLFRIFWQKAACKVPDDPRCLPNFTGKTLAAEWEAAMVGIEWEADHTYASIDLEGGYWKPLASV